jgi:FMN phosphatase YigB (HAD superfamily)
MLIIFDLDDTLFPRLSDNYTEDDLQNISLYSHVKSILSNQGIQSFLVTKGDSEFQNKKIDNLQIRSFFDQIFICKEDFDKKTCFQEIILNNQDKNIFVIGDRINSEIKWGNQLGLTTIHFKRGKYKNLKPVDDSEIANHGISSFEELENIFNNYT